MNDCETRLASMRNQHRRRQDQITALSERISWLHPIGTIRTFRNGLDATATAIAEDRQTIAILESANRQLVAMIVGVSGVAPAA
jgi:hypothetical protein